MKTTIAQKLLLPAMVLLALGMSSCSRYYYKPNSVNAPLLTDAGDAHITINGSTDDQTVDGTESRNRLLNVQGAVSPVKGLGIIGGYTNYDYFVKSMPNPATGDVDAKANLWEIGLGGYYKILETKNAMGLKLVTDLYGGYGAANLTSDVNMRLKRIFLQPGFGMRSNFVDASFNFRFSGIRYSNFNANGRDSSYLRSHNLIDARNQRIDGKNHFFIEPSFTLRGGYKFIKIQFQAVWAAALSNVSWNYDESIFTVGAQISIEEFFKMKRK